MTSKDIKPIGEEQAAQLHAQWQSGPLDTFLQKLESVGFSNEFPADTCTKRDVRESNVYDSDVSYLCLVGMRGTSWLEIRTLRPYVTKYGSGAIYFGWTDGKNAFAHITNGVDLGHGQFTDYVLLAKKLEGQRPSLSEVAEATGFTESDFPQTECTQPSVNGTFIGQRTFLCLIADLVTDTTMVRAMKPFIQQDPDDPTNTLWAWIWKGEGAEVYFNHGLDQRHNMYAGDDQYVFAFCEVPSPL